MESEKKTIESKQQKGFIYLETKHVYPDLETSFNGLTRSKKQKIKLVAAMYIFCIIIVLHYIPSCDSLHGEISCLNIISQVK